MEKLLEIGSKFGLEGKDLMKFVEEQQAYEREDRRKEREIRKLEVEREIEVKQLEEKRAQRRHEQELSESQMRHEIELRTLELQSAGTIRRDGVDRAKAPKLQSFVDGKDELDSYLLRFERFATTNSWDRASWAISLSALLTGKALDVYSRMSDDAAIDYDQLKTALLKRYDFTEDGYRVKFRRAQPESGESPEQFIVRLGSYLQKWITLSNAEKTLDGVCDLIVREQFINTCPRDLSIHLRERAPQNLRELAKIADQFLVAHGKQLYTTFQSGNDEKPILKEGGRRGDYDPYMLQCFICRGYGHRAADCKLQMRAPRRSEKRCYRCQRQGHEAKDCWSSTPTANPFTQKVAGAVYRATPEEVLQDDSCHSNEKIEVDRHQTQTLKVEATEEEIQSCIEDDRLLLACGKTLPIVSNACIQTLSDHKKEMPVVCGRIGENLVRTLRDTGCSGVVVKREFVTEKQLTGKVGYMLLIDNTLRRVPVAKIRVDTPYLTGEVEAQCLPDAIYDLVIGNVQGARAPGDPDPIWAEACAMTRAQAKKTNQRKQIKYVARDETDNKEIDVSGSVLEVTGAAIIEFSESTSDDVVDDDNLLELGACQSKESVTDVRYGQQLTLDQQQELQSVISEYKLIFTDLPGTTDLIKHHVNVTCSDPVLSKPYPIPYRLREMLKNDIRDMLRMGVIRGSTSPYASPVVIVRKKDGSNRVCVDCRKLNKITVFDPGPMGSTDEIFHKLSEDKYFSKFDLSKGYWQVPVAEANIAKTAFITPDGTLYQVSFASKKLIDREKNYSTMEKECLAVEEFVLQTDHEPLLYINKAKLLNGRIMRWAIVSPEL